MGCAGATIWHHQHSFHSETSLSATWSENGRHFFLQSLCLMCAMWSGLNCWGLTCKSNVENPAEDHLAHLSSLLCQIYNLKATHTACTCALLANKQTHVETDCTHLCPDRLWDVNKYVCQPSSFVAVCIVVNCCVREWASSGIYGCYANSRFAEVDVFLRQLILRQVVQSKVWREYDVSPPSEISRNSKFHAHSRCRLSPSQYTRRRPRPYPRTKDALQLSEMIGTSGIERHSVAL